MQSRSGCGTGGPGFMNMATTVPSCQLARVLFVVHTGVTSTSTSTTRASTWSTRWEILHRGIQRRPPCRYIHVAVPFRTTLRRTCRTHTRTQRVVVRA